MICRPMRARRLGQCKSVAAMLRVVLCIAVALLADLAQAAEFRTNDPVKAFVRGEFPLGDDYFIHGNGDTYIFRCAIAGKNYRFNGLALSEISIWGNRTGPWELFRREKSGRFVYAGSRTLSDTGCLEHCRTKDYLASGHCQWLHGWPTK
jgi:hypothetical protein